MRNLSLLRMSITASAVYLSMICVADADCNIRKCEGVLREPHGDTQGYSFATTSRIYLKANVYVYETCVENQASRDMEFNWFVPGPHTFVPAGIACSNPRPMLTHEDLATHKGCFLYGNNWTRDRAQFFPHKSDQLKIDADKSDSTCNNIPQSTNANLGSERDIAIAALKEGIVTDIDAFVPSNAKQPGETMAYVKARVSLDLDLKDPTKYIHTISIQSEAYKNAKPDFEDLKIKPEKGYLQLYEGKEQFSKYILGDKASARLPREITLSTELPIPKSPQLQSVRFELTGGDQTSATLFVPYLMEKQ